MAADGLALLPVVLFLVSLLVMDSFALVRPVEVAGAIAAGCLSALITVWLQPGIVGFGLGGPLLERVTAPVLEESLKAILIVALVSTRRIGFPVDAAIQGFAVGAGFGLVENILYLTARADASLVLWIVRGFGTAVLHGATTGVFAIVSQRLSMRHGARAVRSFLPGLAIAVAMHAGFNNKLLPPFVEMLILLAIAPVIVVYVYEWSEHATREWVTGGLDLDVELLNLVGSDAFTVTHFGQYLGQLRSRFPGPIVADMFCLLRVQLELSAQAKGRLLARVNGLEVPKDADTDAAFAEVDYLRRSIGRTGLAVLKPLNVTSDRDAWHRHVLDG
jgi:protease PrsW